MVPGGMLGLTPLGLLALPLALLLRAAGHGARECPCDALATKTPSCSRCASRCHTGSSRPVVAAVAGLPTVHPMAWQALVAGGVVGATGGFAGAVRAARLWPAVLPAPATGRPLVRGNNGPDRGAPRRLVHL